MAMSTMAMSGGTAHAGQNGMRTGVMPLLKHSKAWGCGNMTRPRGFDPDWRPQAKSQQKLETVQRVLATYREYLPLTIRQIFYRLVGTEVIGKSEKEYANLCELLNRARRARLISMDAIRGDGFSGGTGIRLGYTGPDEFLDEIMHRAKRYRRDRQEGQDRRIVLWCEASGMVPQLQRVANEYGVAVKSSGGFDSLTVKHAVSRQLGADKPATVLHVGDFDPSGEVMFDALAEDTGAFAQGYGNEVKFVRLAVTSEHIAQYGLPTAPPKESTHQMRKQMLETVQAEALDPATLGSIVRQAIAGCMDEQVLEAVMGAEDEEQQRLVYHLGSFGDLREGSGH